MSSKGTHAAEATPTHGASSGPRGWADLLRPSWPVGGDAYASRLTLGVDARLASSTERPPSPLRGAG